MLLAPLLLLATKDTSFELYGVRVRSKFSDPAACPWLRYNYVCMKRSAYTQWLSTWATAASPLRPPTSRLPRGTSLWLGMSHLYQYAAALMCQHRGDLRSLKALRCESAPSACISKLGSYERESQACTGAVLTDRNCKLVDVPTDSRCSPDAWPNVYGINGTHATSSDELPQLQRAAEDSTCGEGRSVWPGCSMSIVSFGFRSGHTALVVHNHPLQFVDDGLAKLLPGVLSTLGLRMSKVDTIVYASPWMLFQAYQRSMCTCREARHMCLALSEGGTFHQRHFRQGILGFARTSNFSGNLVLTTRLLGQTNDDRPAVMALMRMASTAGMDATLVDPSEVARWSVGGQLCSSENVRRPCANGGGHQCTPSVPDLVAWEIQKHLRRTAAPIDGVQLSDS